MKKIFLSLAMVALLATTACDDFLTIKPVSVVSDATVSTPEGVEWLVTAMYSSLYGSGVSGSLSMMAYGDVIGGNANKGSNANDQPAWGELEVYTFSGTNGYITGPWSTFYNGVFRANVVLDKLSKVEGLDADYIKKRTAEAKFLRGVWQLAIVQYYGAAVPYISLEDFQANVDPKVSNVDENGNYIYIWDKIVQDFADAYADLPDAWDAANVGRPNKWAALAYKAKAEVFWSSPYNGKNGTQNKWADAKADLENLINNGKNSRGIKYALHNSYEDLFVAATSDNTSESVFAIEQTIVGTGTTGNVLWGMGQYNAPTNIGGGWGFVQPSTDLAQSYLVDADGVPYTNNEYRNKYPLGEAVSMRLGSTDTVETDLDVYMDPRIDYVLARTYIPYWDWDVPVTVTGYIRDLGNGGLYWPKKHMPKSSDRGTTSLVSSGTSTTKNYNLIRVADLYLWYAEALVQTGTPAAAEEWVNKVRERAGGSYVKAAKNIKKGIQVGGNTEPISSTYVLENKFDNTIGANAAANYRIGPWPASQFATAADAMEAIRYESRAEFAMEGRYWFDLMRWGIAPEQLNAYAEYEKGFLPKYEKAIYAENVLSLPIPTQQILVMQGLLVQNENW